MPIYEYRCDQGHTFEVRRRMVDDPVETCLTCERPVQQVFHPVAVHFKGSGFYNTDYGKRKRGDEGDGEGGGSEKSEGGGESKKSGEGSSSGDSKGSSSESKGSGNESKGSTNSGSKATSSSSSSSDR